MGAVSGYAASAMVRGASFNDKHGLLKKMKMELGSAMWLRSDLMAAAYGSA